MSGHPDLRQLAAFLDGRLDQREREIIEQHVTDCNSCCEAMSKIPQDTLSARLQDVEAGAADSFIVRPDDLRLPEARPDIPPELVEHPRYRVLEPLGEGGMGVVYKAQHRTMDRLVALKVIDARLTKNPQAIVRFRNEVKSAARLSHANIVRAYDAEQEGNLHFLVMEYVDGINLAEFIRRKGPLQVQQACSIVRKVAKALQHAYLQGMVHRDIKPQNIMVSREGRVCVLDFGLARLLRERELPSSGSQTPAEQMQRTASALTLIGSVLGTPDYIAPEQVTDAHTADTRADLYSLGCTFYFLLTGTPPYPTGSVMQKLVAHREDSPTSVSTLRPDTPPLIADILTRMMARRPEDRFQTPMEVVAALESAGPRTVEAVVPDLKVSPVSAAPILRPPQERSHETHSEPPRSPVELPALNELDTVSRIQRQSGKSRRRNAKGVWIIALLAIVVTVTVGLIAAPVAFNGTGNNTAERGSDGESGIPAAAAIPGTEQGRNDQGEWIDLLADFDPAGHIESGVWWRDENSIATAVATNAKLRLLSNAPEEYDLEVTFTRVSGRDSIALIFPADGQQATFELDAWRQHLAGIQRINGLDLLNPDNPTRVTGLILVNGRRYTVMLRVRRDRIEAWLDGTLLTTLRDRDAVLSPLSNWALSDASAIGVGAYLSETVFHRIRLRPMTGVVQ